MNLKMTLIKHVKNNNQNANNFDLYQEEQMVLKIEICHYHIARLVILLMMIMKHIVKNRKNQRCKNASWRVETNYYVFIA